MCPCKKFRSKEEELAHAELKRQSRRDRTKKKAESARAAPHAATVAPQAPTSSPHELAAVTEALPARSAEEEPPKSAG
jgi:hypothetical protein